VGDFSIVKPIHPTTRNVDREYCHYLPTAARSSTASITGE
jgi:hypothetical protein